MKKLLLLLLLPLGLFAHGPSSIMAPTVYDLTGAISEGQKVVSLITDQAEIAVYNLTLENNYLTITTPATFYYALLSDSTGVLTCLYLGPQNIGSTELFIEEIAPMPQTPLSAGLKTAGKGTLISLGTGVVIVFAAVGMAGASSGDSWIPVIVVAAFGVLVAIAGTALSLVIGAAKGIQTSVVNNVDMRRRQKASRRSSGSTSFVVLPMELDQVPEELRIPLLEGRS
ncbi:hypothetical protein N9K91_00635 [Schleiferiaceae bacterium]|nr:hypothetical protein [Schleiferiaceae bacterium]